MAIPFVLMEDVKCLFDDDIVENLGDELTDSFSHIENTYIRGIPARGKRITGLPRFSPQIWNIHNFVIS